MATQKNLARASYPLGLPIHPGYLLLALTGILLFWWMQKSPRPYDDDCVARYFMAKSLLHSPQFLMDLWARPLAMIFFFVPASMGYQAASFFNLLICLGTCFLLWKAMERKGESNAWLVIPLLAFQPVFFMTGWGLVSEPHAAFVFALGLFFFTGGKHAWAAVAWSFLPLGRTEMILALPFLALLFLKDKKYIPILLLGVGLLFYNLVAWMISGNLMKGWELISTYGQGLNYGKISSSHYPDRLIYFAGPVVLALAVLQMFLEAKHRKPSVYTAVFLISMAFHIYITTWGPPIVMGFLRHLVPLSPILAVLALRGLNGLLDGAKDKVFKISVLSVFTLAVLAFFCWNITDDYYLPDKAGMVKWVYELSPGLKNALEDASLQPRTNPVTKESAEYMKLGLLLVMGVLFVLVPAKENEGGGIRTALMIFAGLSGLIYTLAKEKPLAFNAEQQKVFEFQKWFRSSKDIDQKQTVMASHPFFLFKEDYNIYDSISPGGISPILRMRTEQMKNLPVGGYLAWDSHYSHRLTQNVQLNDINGNPAFKYIKDFQVKDRFAMVLFQKVAETPDPFPAPKQEAAPAAATAPPPAQNPNGK